MYTWLKMIGCTWKIYTIYGCQLTLFDELSLVCNDGYVYKSLCGYGHLNAGSGENQSHWTAMLEFQAVLICVIRMIELNSLSSSLLLYLWIIGQF